MIDFRPGHRLTPWGRILLWLLVAAVLYSAGRAMERSTKMEIFSTGSTLNVTIADSMLSAPVAIASVDRIDIRTWDSVFPSGSRSFEIRRGAAPPETIDLSSPFRLPPGGEAPVGDWEIDNRSAHGLVFRREVALSGAFELSAVFTGRVHQHLTVTLRGSPTVSVSFRRGLINNDIFVWNERWEPIAVTSLDPQPAEDVAAAASIVLQSAATAALLIGAFLALAKAGPKHTLNPNRSRPVIGSRAVIVAAGLAVAATSTSLWFADRILERLPHLPDSVVYMLQARWLLDGRLVQPLSAIQQHLDVPFTYVIDGGWIAHYPFGWPALLALGLAVDMAWAVAPILGGVYVLLLWWLGTTLYDNRVGLAAAGLGALSPMARAIFGSHLSHAGSATLILAFLALLQFARRRQSAGWALVAGVVLGLGFGMRPLSALAVAVPCGILMLMDCRNADRSQSSRAELAAVVAGGFIGTLPLLFQNLMVTGNPFALPYSFARGSMYSLANVPYGIQNLDAILASAVPALHGWGWSLSRGWLLTALPLAFAMVPFLLRRWTRTDVLLAGWFLCLMAVHIGTQAHGLHGFGPRYAFDAFAALFLLTARGFQELARIGPGVDPREAATAGVGRRNAATSLAAALLFAVLIGSTAVTLPKRLGGYHGYNRVDGSLERAVDAMDIDRGLILFGTDNWQDWAMASRLMTGRQRHNLVFARSLEDNSALFRACPDLPVFIWDGYELVVVE